MTLALLGILLSLGLLITLAYRGHSVIAVAPVAASIAVIMSGAPLLASYTQIFMPALGSFLIAFFPLFLVGAIFGRLMTISGYAQDLARWISGILGPRFAILVTVLATALLTYGGVSAWVVVFTIFPIGMALFEEADIPRRLMPAAIALGIFTFATAALPGSPQIHNTIPTKFFGTNTFAAPGLGLLAAVLVFGLGMLWLEHRQRQLAHAGESFWDPTHAELKQSRRGNITSGPDTGGASTSLPAADSGGGPVSSGTQGGRGPAVATREMTTTSATTVTTGQTTATRPSASAGLIGLSPILAIVAVNALCTYLLFPAMDFGYLADEKFGATSIDALTGIWSVTVAMLAGIVLVFLMRIGSFSEYVDGLSDGAKNAVLPVFNTASEVGYGAVIASLAVFVAIRDNIFGISDNPLIVAAASTSGISGLTGSASGGLTITLQTFGTDLAQMATDQGISMGLMHRVTAMASIGFDSLPHNGAIITLLLVTGLSHRESYKDIFVVTVLVPLAGLLTVIGLGMAVGSF
ncbi:GntP family permease [Janibacter cremeus]|uniref:H+/gluconate symporter-like permease n=1 Tax=Janibacter cremeus TaxID=1285192 RepID=A0A852VNE0_9MICO|nr:GntP family permease [Janibacter cremeus]NYF96970.1 H+/gluconate symporter-like permease [Janibacter cremeus]